MAAYDIGQVALLLRQIGSHDAVLADSYVNNVIAALDDKQQKQLTLLHKTGLLRPGDEAGDYRLSSEMKRMLNRLMRKQSAYRQLTDMGKVIDVLEETVQDYRTSFQLNQSDDVEYYLDQLDDLLYEAKDNLSVSLDNMHHAISSQFGFVSTLSAKVRENERALNYAQKLLTELSQIDPETCYEWIDWPCPNDFARKITGFIQWFNQTLPRLRHIIEMMRASLFRLRRDEKQTSQLRAMARYLRQHPEFEIEEDLHVADDLPLELRFAEPMALKSYVDVSNTAIEQPLMAIVQALRKQVSSKPLKPRESSHVSTELLEDIAWQSDFFEDAAELLFAQAISSTQTVSALQYWLEQQLAWSEAEQSIEPKAWIELVFSYYCKLTNDLQNAIDIKMKGESLKDAKDNYSYSDIEISLLV